MTHSGRMRLSRTQKFLIVFGFLFLSLAYMYRTEVRRLYKLISAKLFIEQSVPLVMGDSNAYSIAISELVRCEVYNLSVPGITTSYVRQDLELIGPLKNRTVLLHVGINDLRYGADREMVVNRVSELANLISDKGAKLILSLIWPVNEQLGENISNEDISWINEKLREYGNENGIVILDGASLVSKEDKLDRSLSDDGLHLNNKGVKLMANRYSELLCG